MAMPNPWEYADKNNSEYGHQVALFMWATMASTFGLTAANDISSYKEPGVAKAWLEQYHDTIPALSRLFAIGNQGHGDKVRGAIRRAEGVKAGVPDLCLPVPMRVTFYDDRGAAISWVDYHGLYLELKRPKSDGKAEGMPSAEQKDWNQYLNSVGYRCDIAVGWQEARQIMLLYLGVITT